MNKEQIRERLLLDEYEIQHFGFSSSYLITEFKDAINCTIKSIHGEVEKCIARKLQLSDEEKKILNKDIITLSEKYEKQTEKCIQKYEENLKNIFVIPQNIVLESDKIHEQYTDVDEQELSNEIKQLEREYLKEKCLIHLYKEQIKHIDCTSKLQEQVALLLKKINKMPESDNAETRFNNLHNLYEDLIHKFENEFDKNVELQNQFKFLR